MRFPTPRVLVVCVAVVAGLVAGCEPTGSPDTQIESSAPPSPEAVQKLVGPGCAAYAKKYPTGPGSVVALAEQPAAAALADHPMLRLFASAIAGKLNERGPHSRAGLRRTHHFRADRRCLPRQAAETMDAHARRAEKCRRAHRSAVVPPGRGPPFSERPVRLAGDAGWGEAGHRARRRPHPRGGPGKCGVRRTPHFQRDDLPDRLGPHAHVECHPDLQPDGGCPVTSGSRVSASRVPERRASRCFRGRARCSRRPVGWAP